MKQGWMQSLSVYRDRRMVALFFLGFSSGLPRLLVYSTLSFWLLAEGISIENVGLFAATAIPYSLKFIWSPLLDRSFSWVEKSRLGLRRFWMFITQLGLMVSLLALSFLSVESNLSAVAVVAILIAFLSASQDISIDAYRVELLEPEEQGAGAAIAVFGYQVAMLVAGAGALYASVYFESWQATYRLMAILVSVGMVTVFWTHEPNREREENTAKFSSWIRIAVIGPFRSFATYPRWLWILAFVSLFKLGDALAGAMTNPFLVETGFSEQEIANIAKTYGLIAVMLGFFVGGILVRRMGLFSSLALGATLQLLSNLVFCWQAMKGADTTLLVFTIGAEKISAGCGTAAFVAYLSCLCDRTYTATQYALLTALSSLLQTLLSTLTGVWAAALGWIPFFAMTAAAALPGLVLVFFLRSSIDLLEEPSKLGGT